MRVFTPHAFPVRRASREKPVDVMTTLGRPAFSASAAERAAAGAQFPQEPLPEITASHPLSLAAATICRASSRWCEGTSLPGRW